MSEYETGGMLWPSVISVNHIDGEEDDAAFAILTWQKQQTNKAATTLANNNKICYINK
jgi:hypothetical protein